MGIHVYLHGGRGRAPNGTFFYARILIGPVVIKRFYFRCQPYVSSPLTAPCVHMKPMAFRKRWQGCKMAPSVVKCRKVAYVQFSGY